ncbi:MAG TPA: NADH-ubiquinone oxidoreductase-F iron-sulfur binding region domain-containing protein [Acidimicrobiales bacterium]|jgi:NADH-quinone oxidoreductase subunit F|nr:NADH-ubiquinone oxidoreductase-F iron-sulfur binding region domain-containing protein [Acidimicrobiales bacterium]
MDLHLSDAVATEVERNVIDRVLGGRDARWLLLPAFHAVQDHVGWVSPGALNEICRRLDVAPAEAYGVLTFYALLSATEQPARRVHVCTDLACAIAGATVPAGAEAAPCLGLCERAPATLVVQAGDPPRHEVIAPDRPAVPQAGAPGLVLLRRIGVADPGDLDAYRAHGGYAALRRALELGPSGVVREVVDSNLVGRGGAAFPAGRKWEAVARNPSRPHELVCNADESEPGTFKDRVLMEGDPFAVIEAMTIAGYATACERGWIYLRGEYPDAHLRLQAAIDACRTRGLLGPDVMGAGFPFDVTIFRGAGAYICGEETALFNSIEGKRGEPRSKPPFPVDVGLFGRPTLVNNVETLVNVLPIVLDGGLAFATTGTEGSTGTKLFCLSGHVERPGVYEVPFGTNLRELLALSGGVSDGRNVQAVLLGGAAGMFVGPDELDLPLTFEGTRAAGATLGSGVVLVIDDSVDLVPLLRRIAAFFRDESCGQCVPCRVGTVRQEELLERLAHTRRPADLALLADVGQVMQDASICGLGQTAHSAIASAIRKFGLLR